ncbi:Dehydrogenase/reductase SDR family member 7C [Ophiophagus hannah]|uniref:Dehydrogenase/reductase SDR family member 7C n=1 Tax=Ophiophagus hannah TaxID=8665 RepID=V8PJE1_OPHHA|nr:Dehydrogenase/reductase SDR family member 7C [Ophiophagus hannah]
MGIWAILFLPLLVVGISGIIYIYRKVTQLMTKSAVRSKVVVITDGLSGVGKECAQVFHAGGARLILCGKHLDKLEALCDALNSAADPTTTFTPKLILLDLSDVRCIQDVAKEILDCYGCVDILINNASIKAKGTVQNIFSHILLSSFSSQHDLQENWSNCADSASKHAALGFFDCLRAELQEFGVCVSTVSPSFICSDHNQLQPKNCEGASWKNFFRKLAHGVRPTEVAEEILRTVNRKKQEVFMANPIAKAAVYIRTFLPEIFFAVVAAGVKEKQKIEVEN